MSDTSIAVTVTREIRAPVERVFDAWLDPEMVRHWFAPALGPLVRVDIDPVVGGAFYFDQQRGDETARHRGEYLVIERPRRLVFSWRVGGVAEADRVTVQCAPCPAGCLVTVTHEMAAAFADYIAPTRRGWRAMLDGLARGLAAVPPEAPPALVLTREFAASPAEVYAAWTDPALVRQWLFTSPASDRVEVALDVRQGGAWQISDTREGETYTACGEYLHLMPTSELVFTFCMPQFSPNADRITVRCLPWGRGCLMVFRQEGSDLIEELASAPAGVSGGSESGWLMMFSALAGVLTRQRGLARKLARDTVRFERLLPGTVERIWAWLMDSEKRARWLAAGDIPAKEGQVFTLRFHHGALSPIQAPTPPRFADCEHGVTTTHRVLHYAPPHRLAISWDETAQGFSEVLFELAQEGQQVRLVLTHRRLPDQSAMRNVAGGWHTHLAVLEEKLAGRTPESFWTLFGNIEDVYANAASAEENA